MFIGLLLAAIGVIALLIKLEVLSGNLWGYTWPVVLIAVGLRLLLGWRWGRRSWWEQCCGSGRVSREKNEK